VVDRAIVRLGLNAPRSATPSTPLPGARATPEGAAALDSLPSPAQEILRNRYGTRAGIVAQIAHQNDALACPLSGEAPAIGAEVVFAVRYEMARSVNDFLTRRTSMTWRAPHAAKSAAPIVAHLMATALGWPPERTEAQVAGFRRQADQMSDQ
jgi:glycerol-3-phosphate dehydrogenase